MAQPPTLSFGAKHVVPLRCMDPAVQGKGLSWGNTSIKYMYIPSMTALLVTMSFCKFKACNKREGRHSAL